MIALSTPITTSPTFDQLALTSINLTPNGILHAIALPSNGEVMLNGPAKTINKKSSDVAEITDAIVAQAVFQVPHEDPVIRRVVLTSSGVSAPIQIMVWSTAQDGTPNPLWICRDASELIKKDPAFAQAFASTMTAIGNLF